MKNLRQFREELAQGRKGTTSFPGLKWLFFLHTKNLNSMYAEPNETNQPTPAEKESVISTSGSNGQRDSKLTNVNPQTIPRMQPPPWGEINYK